MNLNYHYLLSLPINFLLGGVKSKVKSQN